MNAPPSELTQAQLLIWTGQQLHPDEPLYNMTMAFRIDGRVDEVAFERAFDALVQSTDALRTVFIERNGVPRRMVLDALHEPVEFVDLSGEADAETSFAAWAAAEAGHQFELGSCLYRSRLLRIAPDSHVWWFSLHHLIVDAWSVAVLYRRMEELYRDRLAGGTVHPDYPSFEAYADYEQRFRETEEYADSVAYWEAKTESSPEPPSLYGEVAPPIASTRTDRVTHVIEGERARRYAAVVAELGGGGPMVEMTRFSVIAAALLAVIARLSGQRDLTLLAPALNRPSQKFKQTAGLFMEVLPLHVSLGRTETFRSLIELVSTELRDLLMHARPGTSNAGHNRKYPVLLNFLTSTFGDFNGFPMRSEWVHSGHGDADHKLRLQVHDFDSKGNLQLHFDLSRDVFDEARETSFRWQFDRMLNALLDDLDAGVFDVDLTTPAEQSVLREFNDTTESFAHSDVLAAFRHQVRETPLAPAVIEGSRAITYAELDEMSDRLAHLLLQRAGGPDLRVALYLPRSVDLLIAIWGVFKAGGAYVPIDRSYPNERVEFLVADSNAQVVITDDVLRNRLSDLDVAVVTLADLPDLVTSPSSAIGADDIAYVMYTSGSTGRPKGVMVGHAALANYVQWAAKEYSPDGAAVAFPLYSSVAFDLTVTSLFVPLVTGGPVVVYPEPDGNDLSVLDVFQEDAVDVVKLTPAHLALLEPELLRTTRIRTLILGGEDLKSAAAKRAWDASGGKLEIINEYGPTEATVGCMLHRFDPDVDTSPSVPIGRPAANMRIHLVDEQLNFVPTGVVGELCVAGIGVAHGYLNRPELSMERFVPDPLHPEERLYRTGDLGRWLEPGRIQFLGRADDQVKIRGFRIELGEVEAAMRSHPGIDDVVVEVVESETALSVRQSDDDLCVRCGLTNSHPDAQLDEDSVCQPCRFYEQHREDAAAYFSTAEAFDALFDGIKSADGSQDCLMLLSGGKDSTYALYQLVERGLTPLVFSLDNGYIAEGAKANIQRAVDDLDLELVWGTTTAMNAIFADSLGQFSNVCQGCFKTIYTLGISLAHERGLRRIVTGLSRGQIFETRLADLFRIGITEPDEVDAAIVEARKAYHRMDDAVLRCLDTEIFQEDATFEDILLVDFYRYFDVGLSEIYGFLGTRAPWVRPSDTGRSTNCLINNTGIFVHKNERGFHNYALPYSWDVRLGHKTRDAALAELDDDIDVTQVRSILQSLPYEMKPAAEVATGAEKRLVGFYVAEGIQSSEVRRHLAERLPEPMIPSYVVRLDAMPLTINGKVDRRALPDPRTMVGGDGGDYVDPRNDIEQQLVDIWSEVLGVGRVGVTDDFFELGGDSIMNIQIVSQARSQGLDFTPQDLFQSKTIESLARAVGVATVGAGPIRESGGLAEIELSEEEMEALLRDYGEPS